MLRWSKHCPWLQLLGSLKPPDFVREWILCCQASVPVSVILVLETRDSLVDATHSNEAWSWGWDPQLGSDPGEPRCFLQHLCPLMFDTQEVNSKSAVKGIQNLRRGSLWFLPCSRFWFCTGRLKRLVTSWVTWMSEDWATQLWPRWTLESQGWIHTQCCTTTGCEVIACSCGPLLLQLQLFLAHIHNYPPTLSIAGAFNLNYGTMLTVSHSWRLYFFYNECVHASQKLCDVLMGYKLQVLSLRNNRLHSVCFNQPSQCRSTSVWQKVWSLGLCFVTQQTVLKKTAIESANACPFRLLISSLVPVAFVAQILKTDTKTDFFSKQPTQLFSAIPSIRGQCVGALFNSEIPKIKLSISPTWKLLKILPMNKDPLHKQVPQIW